MFSTELNENPRGYSRNYFRTLKETTEKQIQKIEEGIEDNEALKEHQLDKINRYFTSRMNDSIEQQRSLEIEYACFSNAFNKYVKEKVSIYENLLLSLLITKDELNKPVKEGEDTSQKSLFINGLNSLKRQFDDVFDEKEGPVTAYKSENMQITKIFIKNGAFPILCQHTQYSSHFFIEPSSVYNKAYMTQKLHPNNASNGAYQMVATLVEESKVCLFLWHNQLHNTTTYFGTIENSVYSFIEIEHTRQRMMKSTPSYIHCLYYLQGGLYYAYNNGFYYTVKYKNNYNTENYDEQLLCIDRKGFTLSLAKVNPHHNKLKYTNLDTRQTVYVDHRSILGYELTDDRDQYIESASISRNFVFLKCKINKKYVVLMCPLYKLKHTSESIGLFKPIMDISAEDFILACDEDEYLLVIRNDSDNFIRLMRINYSSMTCDEIIHVFKRPETVKDADIVNVCFSSNNHRLCITTKEQFIVY